MLFKWSNFVYQNCVRTEQNILCGLRQRSVCLPVFRIPKMCHECVINDIASDNELKPHLSIKLTLENTSA